MGLTDNSALGCAHNTELTSFVRTVSASNHVAHGLGPALVLGPKSKLGSDPVQQATSAPMTFVGLDEPMTLSDMC